jgi:hypothetical protein
MTVKHFKHIFPKKIGIAEADNIYLKVMADMNNCPTLPYRDEGDITCIGTKKVDEKEVRILWKYRPKMLPGMGDTNFQAVLVSARYDVKNLPKYADTEAIIAMPAVPAAKTFVEKYAEQTAVISKDISAERNVDAFRLESDLTKLLVELVESVKLDI